MNSEEKKWFALDVTVASDAAEAVEFALGELDALGTEINNLGKIKPEYFVVTGYFNDIAAPETTTAHLTEALRIYGFTPAAVREHAWREVVNEDWLAEWKKHWKPTESAKFIVAPTWEKVENTEKIIIRIEPSMAFGTGTHETTRLCLRAIEENYQPNETFFDVGTGTGILAIAVAELNRLAGKPLPRVVGCDTDFDSITIARENLELNGAPNIELYVGSISAETPKFDFVCANVTLNVIAPMLALLLEKSNRRLVLSGILKDQEAEIIAELKKFGVENSHIETLGEWISVTVVKSFAE